MWFLQHARFVLENLLHTQVGLSWFLMQLIELIEPLQRGAKASDEDKKYVDDLGKQLLARSVL
jgi:hypothetical protein